jgi:hypothetical protein
MGWANVFEVRVAGSRSAYEDCRGLVAREGEVRRVGGFCIERALRKHVRLSIVGLAAIPKVDRLKRAKAEGDLAPDADPADLARYLSIVIYGITIQAAGGATRKELRGAAALAMRSWPQGPDAKGRQNGKV